MAAQIAELFASKSQAEISFTMYNLVKHYNDGMSLFKFRTPKSKLNPQFTYSHQKGQKSLTPPKPKDPNAPPAERSIRRTQTVISDIVRMNEFTMFGTFTFNGSEEMADRFGYQVTDRHNVDECKRKLSKWLNNQRRIIGGSFDYLIIPEYHKDGAVHFHGILSGYPTAKLKDSNHVDNKRRKIYNIPAYKLGHSNFSFISNKEATAKYIKKYITKDMPMLPGKQRYMRSNGLTMPTITYNEDEATLLQPGQEPVYQHELFDKFEIGNPHENQDLHRQVPPERPPLQHGVRPPTV